MVFPEQLYLKKAVNLSSTARSWCVEDVADTRPEGQLELEANTNNTQIDCNKIVENRPTTQLNIEDTEMEKTSVLTGTSGNISGLHLEEHHSFRQRIRYLIRSFNERFVQIRRHEQATPSHSLTRSESENSKNIKPTSSLNPSVKFSNEESRASSDREIRPDSDYEEPVENHGCDTALDPQGKVFITWLLLVTVAYMYNSWVIPLRSTFPYQTPGNVHTWMVFDYIADFIYLIDLLFIKPRVMYLSDGFWIREGKLTRQTYFHKSQFKMDVLSLLPLDLLCLKYGLKSLPLYRLPRLFKIQTFWEFYNRCDSLVASAYVVRVARTLTYMLYLVHLNACAYYAFSFWEGLGTNGWVFNGKGNAYIRCFYFATKTATSIGKNPKPENEVEYMFMTCSWLMGVFVFALLIGQIRDIIATATRSRTEYRKLVDETLEYMRRLNLPFELQERVKLWFKFTWEQQHTFNEASLLDTLPHKMKTDVAINVHIQTLSKVQLFHDCDKALLRELVLKLRPVLFLPGDFVCRKGEVGKEMYIVKTGMVQVMGDSDTEVLATLREGSVFGEISLLSLTGGNRRTATVKSGGFSNVFILSKSDLNEALVHYPDAQEILKKKAQQLMRENAERERLNRLREQAEQSEEDFTEDDTEDDTENSIDTKTESNKNNETPNDQPGEKNDVTSGITNHVSSTSWLTLSPSTELNENRFTSKSRFCPRCNRRIDSKSYNANEADTIQCHVTVHQEMS